MYLLLYVHNDIHVGKQLDYKAYFVLKGKRFRAVQTEESAHLDLTYLKQSLKHITHVSIN